MSKQMKSVTLDPKLVEAINEERRRSLAAADVGTMGAAVLHRSNQ